MWNMAVGPVLLFVIHPGFSDLNVWPLVISSVDVGSSAVWLM